MSWTVHQDFSSDHDGGLPQVYMCRIPETIIFADGQPSRWFSSDGIEGKLLSRPLGDRPWDFLTSIMRKEHRALPPELRKGDANCCVLWMQDADHNFSTKVVLRARRHSRPSMPPAARMTRRMPLRRDCSDANVFCHSLLDMQLRVATCKSRAANSHATSPTESRLVMRRTPLRCRQLPVLEIDSVGGDGVGAGDEPH